jgi:mRNA interferase HigB
MRIITRRRLRDFAAQSSHRDAARPLADWADLVSLAAWKSPADVKSTFGKRVDFVKTLRTGATVAVFDVAANKYRLIAAIHYLDEFPELGRVYVLRILTHREYDRNEWKREL